MKDCQKFHQKIVTLIRMNVMMIGCDYSMTVTEDSMAGMLERESMDIDEKCTA